MLHQYHLFSTVLSVTFSDFEQEAVEEKQVFAVFTNGWSCNSQETEAFVALLRASRRNYRPPHRPKKLRALVHVLYEKVQANVLFSSSSNVALVVDAWMNHQNTSTLAFAALTHGKSYLVDLFKVKVVETRKYIDEKISEVVVKLPVRVTAVKADNAANI